MLNYVEWLRDFPNFSLQDALDSTREEFSDAFNEYWGLNAETCPPDHAPDDWEQYRELDRLASRLGDGVATLVRPRKLPEARLDDLAQIQAEADAMDEALREMIRELEERGDAGMAHQVRGILIGGYVRGSLGKFNFFRRAMQNVADKKFAADIDGYADRMIELIGHLTRSRDPRTQAYLARVAECYVRGMDAEFAVMARAVMHTALERVLPEEAARDLVRPDKRGYLGLQGHMDGARAAGLVDEEIYRSMERVKEAGDNAAHAVPELAPAASQLIDSLSSVLRHLEQFDDAE